MTLQVKVWVCGFGGLGVELWMAFAIKAKINSIGFSSGLLQTLQCHEGLIGLLSFYDLEHRGLQTGRQTHSRSLLPALWTVKFSS